MPCREGAEMLWGGDAMANGHGAASLAMGELYTGGSVGADCTAGSWVLELGWLASQLLSNTHVHGRQSC